MSLFVDGVEPSKIFSGDAAVASVFVGAEKVWPKDVVIELRLNGMGVTGLDSAGGVAYEFDQVGERIWVTCPAAQTVEIVELLTKSVVETVHLNPVNGVAPALNPPQPTGSSMYIEHNVPERYMALCDYDNGYMRFLDTQIFAENWVDAVADHPRSCTFTPDWYYLLISDSGPDGSPTSKLHFYTFPSLEETIEIPGSGGGYVAVTGDGARAYVSSIDGTLSEVDIATKTVISSVKRPAGQLAIAKSGGVERLFVAAGGMAGNGPARVDIIDTADNTLIKSVEGFDGATAAIVASPDNRVVYVGTYTGTKTYMLDAATGEILSEDGNCQLRFQITVADDPGSAKYCSLVGTASLAGEGAGTLEVFDATYPGRGTPAP